MTPPETTAQDTFLRRFAEALGFRVEEFGGGIDPETNEPIPEFFGFSGPFNREKEVRERGFYFGTPLDWLLTNDGMAYLIALARAEGWVYWTFNDFNGGLLVQTLYRQDEVCVEDIPEWSTRVAYAVAKMKGVPLPEGVE